LAFGFDGGKFGGSILSVSIIHSKNNLGSKDVRNSHVLGIGEVSDSRSALLTNFPEVVTYLSTGPFFC
jgi:hypothetical protein